MRLPVSARSIAGGTRTEPSVGPISSTPSWEIRNAAYRLVPRRASDPTATPEQTADFVAFLSQLPIGLDSLPDDEPVMTLARKHGLTFYDAAYLELAKREAIPLATLDKELVKAARAEDVPLVLAAP